MSELVLSGWVRELLAERYASHPRLDDPVNLVWKYVVLRAPASFPADGCTSAPLAAVLFNPTPVPLDKSGAARRLH